MVVVIGAGFNMGRTGPSQEGKGCANERMGQGWAGGVQLIWPETPERAGLKTERRGRPKGGAGPGGGKKGEQRCGKGQEQRV